MIVSKLVEFQAKVENVNLGKKAKTKKIGDKKTELKKEVVEHSRRDS